MHSAKKADLLLLSDNVIIRIFVEGCKIFLCVGRVGFLYDSGSALVEVFDGKETGKLQKNASEIKMVLKKIQNMWYDI